MLFGVRLNNEIYPPWKDQYLHYERLKKLLKEGVIGDGGEMESWTEEDETRFVELLDKELEKVYSFEKSQYEKLSDRLSKIEDKMSDLNVDPKQIESDAEDILEIANNLDKFRRLNFTGFSKIVKKHDRLHQKYQVKPLLQVRLSDLPFNSEDYSPLLYRLSGVYAFLSENFGSQSYSKSASAMMNSFTEGSALTTYRFWIHPENIMEVKTKILRHLPVLVYNREDDDSEEGSDPKISFLYFDSPGFDIYQTQLEKKRDDKKPLLYLTWNGPLTQGSDITLEEVGGIDDTHDSKKIHIKEKYIQPFITGQEKVIDKTVSKMKSRGSNANAALVSAYEKNARALQAYITENRLTPVMRASFSRTAFEIPGDDAVRITLDSDLSFIREDAFNRDSPIRDPDNWRRNDIDLPNVDDPLKYVRKSEYSKFPYAVLDVRVKRTSSTAKYPAWIDELASSYLVTEVPGFSRYVQGVSSLFAEDDRLGSLPFWITDLDRDIRLDPTEAYKRQREKMLERAKRRRQSSAAAKNAGVVKRLNGPGSSAAVADDDDEDDEFLEEDSSAGEEDDDSSSAITNKAGEVGFPTWTSSEGQGPKLLDMDSEDEEIDLPAGVVQPQTWLKNSGAVKVETKVWLANERTFNKWLHITTLLSAMTFTLFASVQKSVNEQAATFAAYILFILTIFSGLWGYFTYLQRLHYIKERSEKHLDSPVGPLIIAIGLLACLVINFTSVYSRRKQELAALA